MTTGLSDKQLLAAFDYDPNDLFSISEFELAQRLRAVADLAATHHEQMLAAQGKLK